VSLAMLAAAAAIVYWLLAAFASGRNPR
jgi:hypothetical protein